MPYYHKMGRFPHKRHTAFRKADGGIYYEHLIGNLGFTGLQSILYTIRRPTTVESVTLTREIEWQTDPDITLRNRHFRTHALQSPGPSPVLDRIPLFFNQRVGLLLSHPTGTDEAFYRNGQGDEIVYVTKGGGVLESQMGELPFRAGDYVVIPRGIIHRWRLDDTDQIFFHVESKGYVHTPRRYRNEHGQLLEHSPFCERDIRPPEDLVVYDEKGEFPVIVKQRNAFHTLVLDHHPFDIVGWDGFYYPWAFNIEDFEPITGRVHQPPPVHQTFAGDGYVVCSFVPRLFDYHPESIPAPYHHSNVMSDEIIYYVSEEFMSRADVEQGSITHHPDGMVHGPAPGKTEGSIGAKMTNELAVMVDTFDPLHVAADILPSEDRDYVRSWLE
jgi:homogentisate 1,2-dioxygenase